MIMALEVMHTASSSTALVPTHIVSMQPNLVSDDIINERKFVPNEIYPLLLPWLPITTVDFVPVRVIDGVRHFMLGLRTEAPFQNQWFVAGGKKNFGERTLNALARQVKRELGLDIEQEGVKVTFIEPVDVLNPASDTRPEWHSNWLFHEILITDDAIEVKALAENKEVRWFTQILPEFPEPVKEALRLLGFEDAPE